jgi:glycopeptide antibiotics resistance protein
VIFWLTFWCRPSGSRIGVHLRLFSTWGNNPWDHAYFIENLFMMVPLGVILPMRFKVFRRWYLVAVTSLCFSLLIETSQYLTSRGFCQLDDVVTNVAGAVAACVAVLHLRKRKKD